MASLLRSTPSAPSAARAREIAALGPWFHNLHLPDGAQTAPDHPLGDFPAFKWRQLASVLPSALAGWRALDIGCNAGFYSFELARRGATVTGIDVDPTYLAQARWAAGEYGLQNAVEFRHMQVYDLVHEYTEYDLVLFMGVFYHLRYATLGLDIVARLVRRLMVFQTLTMPGDEVMEDAARDRDIMERDEFAAAGWPKLAFIEDRFAGDPTNWWAPNHAAVLALLRSCGMRVIGRPGHEIYLCEPNPDSPGWTATIGADELRSATGRARGTS